MAKTNQLCTSKVRAIKETKKKMVGSSSSKDSNFFLISPKDPFDKQFLKTVTIFKSSSEAPFLREIGKSVKIALNPEIMQIEAFSKRSYQKRKGSLYFIFTSFGTHFSKVLSSYISSRCRIFFLFLTPVQRK